MLQTCLFDQLAKRLGENWEQTIENIISGLGSMDHDEKHFCDHTWSNLRLKYVVTIFIYCKIPRKP